MLTILSFGTSAETISEKIPSRITDFFENYGLAFIMVASYFGSGSVYIASEAGVQTGFTLMWAALGAVLLGFMAQDMSGRLGIHGEPLMVFIRHKLGKPLATLIGLWVSIGCIAWTLGLVSAVGASVQFLSGGAIAWQPVAVVTTFLAIAVGLVRYKGVEIIMTLMMISLMIIYLIVATPSNPDFGSMAIGFVPSEFSPAALVIAAGLLGTTALWPNFFLESILVERKGWTDESDIPEMRKDLAMAYAVGGITTFAILIVGAAVLAPMGYDHLETFVTPGEALVDAFGTWAMVLFLIGVSAAAFNSIIPIMWTPAYIIPQAMDIEINKTDRLFKILFVGGTLTGVLSPFVASLLNLGPVDMVVIFPTYNGIFALPLVAVLLFWAVNDKKTMGEHRNTPLINVVNFLLIAIAVTTATLALPDFIDIVAGGGFGG